jgi:predicted dehydrogenase
VSRLRVGVVGCGNIAVGYHLPAFRELTDRFEVVAVADPTPERLELGRQAAGLPAGSALADPMALIARDDVDVVVLCTPQHHRRDLLLAAAAAGKHVLSEKPLAAVPAEAAEMVAAAEMVGITLAVVHNYLFLPEIAAARRLVASGEIGDVRAVTVNYLGVTDSPGAAGYRPNWRHDPRAAGGGVLIDMLHAVYLAEHLLGRPIERVSAYTDSTSPDRGVEEIALCRFEADGAAALVNMAWGWGPGGVTVTGTRGRVVVRYADDGTPPWAPFERLTVTTAAGTRTESLPPGEDLHTAMHAAICATLLDVADALDGRRPPAADGRSALHVLTTTLAAYTSATLGRTVAADLSDAEPVFAGGVGALRELDAPDWTPVRRRGLFGVPPSPDLTAREGAQP